jgi:hypothetical protein
VYLVLLLPAVSVVAVVQVQVVLAASVAVVVQVVSAASVAVVVQVVSVVSVAVVLALEPPLASVVLVVLAVHSTAAPQRKRRPQPCSVVVRRRSAVVRPRRKVGVESCVLDAAKSNKHREV